MKKVFMLIVALATMLTLGACTTKPAAKPRVLTAIMNSNDGWIKNFNPLVNGTYDFNLGFMYEPLVVFDSYNNNQETMWLAEDIISEPDNKTLTVKVRKGVKWSDGTDFTAKDVAFSFTYSKDYPDIDRVGDWGENGRIESVNIVDDYTVQIVMKEANRFHRTSVFFQKWMLPEHIFSKITNPASAVIENPVVTGPFAEVISFTPEMVVLGRNKTYWQADKLKVDELHVPQFNGNPAALALLQSGSVDWAHIFIPDADKNYVQGDANRKFWYGTNDAVRLSFNYMTPNKDNLKAFNDVAFRRAVSTAVDRKGIIDSAVYGYLMDKMPSNTGLPPALFGYEDETATAESAKYAYNIDLGKQLLADAGYKDVNGDGFVENPDGTVIKFDILSPAGWTDWNDGASIAAEGMRAMGINATAKATDLGLIIESWATGNHDMLYTGYGASANVWKYYYDTIGDQSRVKTSSWWSITQTNFVNQELSDLIDSMPTMGSDEEVKAAAAKVEQYFAENMINVPVLYNGNWFVYNTTRWTGWSTKENTTVNPAICNMDAKLLQLMLLEPVEEK